MYLSPPYLWLCTYGFNKLQTENILGGGDVVGMCVCTEHVHTLPLLVPMTQENNYSHSICAVLDIRRKAEMIYYISVKARCCSTYL